MPTTVKVYFSLPTGKQEIRRFTTEAENVLAALTDFLTQTYERSGYEPPLRFSINYDDGEDMCSVNSEAELQEGLRLHAASGAGGVLKLLCSFDQSPVQPASGVASPSGFSTPVLNCPPSPSQKATASAPAPGEETVPEAAPASAPTVEDAPLETNDEEGVEVAPAPAAAPASPAVAVEDVELVNGNDSDAEYERIDVEDDAKSEPKAAPVFEDGAASSPPAVVEEPAASNAPAAVSDAVETEELAEPSPPPRVEEIEPCQSPVEIEDVTSHPASAAPAAAAAAEQAVHYGFTCDFCGASPICGTRFHCNTCTIPGGYDLCSACNDYEGHFPLSHELVAIKEPIPIASVVAPEPVAEPAAALAPASSSSSVPPATVQPVVVHEGITCDGCGQSPLTGNRYHCTTCDGKVAGGYDLCESCESQGTKHPSSHVMMKLRVPAAQVAQAPRQRGRGHCPFRPRRPDASGERPKAQFVSDVTVADGAVVHAGETLRKTWSIKNVGSAPWPAGVRLVFAGGELAPESDNRADSFGAVVPFAGPGDIVHVSIDILVPKEAGRFRGTFRLQTAEGERFGPRIWIDLSVPADEPAPASASAPEAKPELAQPKPAEASAPAPAVAVPVAMPVASPKPVAQVPAPAPVSASAQPAVASNESKQRDEEAALAAEFSAAHIAPVAVPTPSFPYTNQLAILRSMGFQDRELCRYLLLNNRGDVEKAVQWLLQENKH